MPPLNLPWTILERPVKPVAFGFSVLMATLVFANLYDTGVMKSSKWGDVVAIVSTISWFCLTYGWWGRSQRAIEFGLVCAAGVYVTRGTYLFLVNGANDELAWLCVGAVVIAAGSYLLERVDMERFRRASMYRSRHGG